MKQYASHPEAIKAISKVLSLNKINTNRRITGVIQLKPNEIELLLRHYNLSLDSMFVPKENIYLGKHLSNKGTAQKEESYLRQLTWLNEFHNFPDFISHFMGNEIPFYHLSNFPELVDFKSFQWERLSLTINQSSVYSLPALSEKNKSLITQVGKGYNQLKTIEIWDKNALTTHLKQLKFSYDANQISKENALQLLHLFKEVLQDLEVKVMKGSKNLKDNNLEVYYSDLPIPNNLWVGISKEHSDLNHIAVGFDPPRDIILKNQKLIEQTLKRFYRLKDKCKKITKAGEITRRRLFQHYRIQIQNLLIEISKET